MKRRTALKSLGLLGMAGVSLSSFSTPNEMEPDSSLKFKGKINHSVAFWTYEFLGLEKLCGILQKWKVPAIDLLYPDQWAVAKKHNLYVSMCYPTDRVSLVDGWNDKKNHKYLVDLYKRSIPLVKEAGYKNIICFSGNRRGMPDDVGLKNCTEGLKQIMQVAEKNGVTVQMELFNSKVDHKDYMCDNTPWAINLCKEIGSSNFQLLYDIYHMQVNEGNIIHTIKNNHQYFGHYHTAGVPGRHEIGSSQELNYQPVMQAIYDTGFKGHVAQEFIATPKTDTEKLKSLIQAFKICDI